jgi:hypothetical protein
MLGLQLVLVAIILVVNRNPRLATLKSLHLASDVCFINVMPVSLLYPFLSSISSMGRRDKMLLVVSFGRRREKDPGFRDTVLLALVRGGLG